MTDIQKSLADIAAVREYARGGILASTSINSAALLAVVAKIADLATVAPDGLMLAMTFWGAGLGLSVLCWLAAFFAGNEYSKGHHDAEKRAAILWIAMFVASVLLFFLGVLSLAHGVMGGS